MSRLSLSPCQLDSMYPVARACPRRDVRVCLGTHGRADTLLAVLGPQCPRPVVRVAQCLSESCRRPGPETALGLGWPLKAAVILTGTWLLLTREAALSPDPAVAGGLSFTPQWCPRLLLYPLSSKVCELGNPSTCHSFHGLALGVVRPRHSLAQMRVPRIKLVYAGLGEQRKQWPAPGSPSFQGASERQ